MKTARNLLTLMSSSYNRLLQRFGSSIVVLFPQNELSGNVMRDSSIHSYHGAYSNITLGASGIGDSSFAARYEGVNSVGNVYSARLAAAFNPAECTVFIWAKVANAGVWTDGINHRMAILKADASNGITIEKFNNNNLLFQYNAGGTAQTIQRGGTTTTDWMLLVLSISKSNDRVRAYYNNVQIGTDQSGLGTWTGSLASTTSVIGSNSTTPSTVWAGTIGPVMILNREATAADISFVWNGGYPGHADFVPELLDGLMTITDGWAVGSNTTFALDTQNVKYVPASIALSATAGNLGLMTKTIALNLSAYLGFSYWIYVPSIVDTASAILILSSTTNFSKYFTHEYKNLIPGWNHVFAMKSDFTNTGGDDWSNLMVRSRLEVSQQVGRAPSGSFNQLQAQSISTSKPHIMFTFDDGDATVYSAAYPILAAANMPATAYVIGSLIGAGGYMTVANLTDLKTAGWSIANHTYNHALLPSLADQAAVEAELAAQETWMIANGFSADRLHLAYPGGDWDQKTILALEARGYLTGRVANQFYGEQINWKDNPYTLVIRYPANGVSVATAEGWIDTAIADGTSVILMFHIVGPGSDPDIWATANFQALVTYIAGKVAAGACDVVTVSSWWSSL